MALDTFFQGANLLRQLQQQQVQNLTSTTLANVGVELNSNPTAQGPTLYVQDTFTSSSPDDFMDPARNPHGISVSRAIRQEGFQGRVVGTDDTTISNNPTHLSRAATHLGHLSQPGRTREEVFSDIQGYATESPAHTLEQKSDYLDNLSSRGATNSVANFSQARSKAQLTRLLYNEVLPAFGNGGNADTEALQRSQTVLTNMAGAFGLEQKRLTDPNPEIHQPERARLVQGLIDQVSHGIDTSPVLSSARSRYDGSVAKFEANRNSVVISAGNEGSVGRELQSLNGGIPLNLPPDFSRNILENDAVTSVGATDSGLLPNGKVGTYEALYSSQSSGIDIYANGNLQAGGPFSQTTIQGTSFAAPRVAALMADIHRQNPQYTSTQVEKALRQQTRFSLNLSSNGQSVPVLHEPPTSQFLASNTF